jgi:hypothetical protein
MNGACAKWSNDERERDETQTHRSSEILSLKKGNVGAATTMFETK